MTQDKKNPVDRIVLLVQHGGALVEALRLTRAIILRETKLARESGHWESALENVALVTEPQVILPEWADILLNIGVEQTRYSKTKLGANKREATRQRKLRAVAKGEQHDE